MVPYGSLSLTNERGNNVYTSPTTSTQAEIKPVKSTVTQPVGATVNHRVAKTVHRDSKVRVQVKENAEDHQVEGAVAPNRCPARPTIHGSQARVCVQCVFFCLWLQWVCEW